VTLAEFIALAERYHTPGHDVAVAANRAIETINDTYGGPCPLCDAERTPYASLQFDCQIHLYQLAKRHLKQRAA
jgi:hypothetical protein